ncbi:hypothetical protein V5799_008784 [Amblyomma americanum]|uniref:GH18 domain-containing protein n=1 Tax=Amblyomma americanum TaxID=6943 RepID=A0AAQ4FC93_AMBAM
MLDAGYDIPAIDRYLDWMNVIGYDIRGVWNTTDIPSVLHGRAIYRSILTELNVEQGLQALLDRGASKRKLVLGVAFYGRVYMLASADKTGLHAPIDIHNKPQWCAFLFRHDMPAYLEACRNVELLKPMWIRQIDKEGLCLYATNGEDMEVYEDLESIAHKVEFVRKEGYAGIMVMSCDKDAFICLRGKNNALLEKINNGIPRLRNNLVVL